MTYHSIIDSCRGGLMVLLSSHSLSTSVYDHCSHSRSAGPLLLFFFFLMALEPRGSSVVLGAVVLLGEGSRMVVTLLVVSQIFCNIMGSR